MVALAPDADRMIEVRSRDQGLVRRLTEKARKLGEAHVATRVLARRRDDRRWRSPALLWPLYTKD